MRALWVMLLVAGCTDDKYLIITVDARPAVHGASSLLVTLSNSGTSRMDTLPLGSHTFPATFSVTAPGRSGALDIKVEAEASDMTIVGRGSGSVTIGATDASVMLDSTDFVVNTDYAMDQFLNQDYETSGFQLAATSDNRWTAGFRDSCNAGACTIFGREFDQNGAPVSTAAAAGTNAFAFSSTLTTQGAMPALAASGTSTLAFWDYTDTVGSGTGVACRSIDSTGNLIAGQLSVATDAADTVGATPLSSGNVAVTWQIYSPNAAVRSVIVRPDCTALGTVVTVSTTVGTLSGPHRAAAAANGMTVLYAWIQDGDVHVRTGNNTSLVGNDTLVIAHTSTLEVKAVRVAPMGSGFGLAVRWGSPTDSPGPGKIELFQVATNGTTSGMAQLVTDQSMADFSSGEQSFGIATNPQGRTLIAWHVCDSNGTTCDVFGRLAKADGTMDGDTFIIPTTTDGDQVGPSVVALPNSFAVAWTDTSHVAPDTQGTAVRARIVYPP